MVDKSWKPNHKKCNEFWEKEGYFGVSLNTNWSKMTAVAHPTKFAAFNSTHCASLWTTAPLRAEESNEVMNSKVADFLANIAVLAVHATVEHPRLISLGLDPLRMQNVDAFRANVEEVVLPILQSGRNNLPQEATARLEC